MIFCKIVRSVDRTPWGLSLKARRGIQYFGAAAGAVLRHQPEAGDDGWASATVRRARNARSEKEILVERGHVVVVGV